MTKGGYISTLQVAERISYGTEDLFSLAFVCRIWNIGFKLQEADSHLMLENTS